MFVVRKRNRKLGKARAKKRIQAIKKAELESERQRRLRVHTDGTPMTDEEIKRQDLIDLMKNLKV